MVSPGLTITSYDAFVPNDRQLIQNLPIPEGRVLREHDSRAHRDLGQNDPSQKDIALASARAHAYRHGTPKSRHAIVILGYHVEFYSIW